MTLATAHNHLRAVDNQGFNSAVEVHVLGVLEQDLRSWVDLLDSAAKGELMIPRTKAPHMHPADPAVPCMFCAAHVSDLHTVSGAIILSLAEAKFRDDQWNADSIRLRLQVVSAAKTIEVSEGTLCGMFGEHWAMVVSLGYRIEMADATELVHLLRKSMSHPESVIAPRVDGRDYTHTARWLVSSAMSSKRETSMSSRMKQREYAGRLSTLAALIARKGNPDSDSNLMEWLPVTNQTEAPLAEMVNMRTTLRVVR